MATERDGNGAYSQSPSPLTSMPHSHCGEKIPPISSRDLISDRTPTEIFTRHIFPFFLWYLYYYLGLEWISSKFNIQPQLKFNKFMNKTLTINKLNKIVQLKSNKKKRGWGFFHNWGQKSGMGTGMSPKAGKHEQGENWPCLRSRPCSGIDLYPHPRRGRVFFPDTLYPVAIPDLITCILLTFLNKSKWMAY